MKRLTIVQLLFLFTAIGFSSHAQQFKWVKGGGTAEDFTTGTWTEQEQVHCMCTDPNGNVYIVSQAGGTFPVIADTFHASAYGDENVLITSYNCNGQMRWAKLITSTGADCISYTIATDNLGHVYVGGSFDPLGHSLYVGGDTSISGYLYQSTGMIQFDTAGRFDWIRFIGDNTISTLSATDHANVIVVDGDNNVHLLNYMKNGVHIMPGDTSITGTYDFKYDVSGTLLAVTRMALGPQWIIGSVVSDPTTKKLYTCGQINLDVFGGYYPGHVPDTFFAAAFDTGDHLLWQYFTGDDTQASAISGVVLDQTKRLHFSGASSPYVTGIPATFSFNGMSVSNTHSIGYAMSVVFTTDTNGHPQWIRHFDATATSINSLNDITLLPNCKVAAGGTYAGPVTDGVHTITTPPGEAQNPFLVILDSTGDLQTITHMDGDGFYNACFVVTSDKIGNIYIGGEVEDSIWAGVPAIPAYHSMGGNTDYMIAKYGVDCACLAMPAASFTSSGTRTVNSTYTGTTTGLDSLVWSFGDGNAATGTTALHTYTIAGTFQFCVTAYTDCGNDSDCTTIVVPCVGPPVAAFTYTGMDAISTTYTGTTTGLDSVLWIYGDGHTDTGLTATHVYSAIGTYHIYAVAYNPCGTDTVSKYDTVLCIAAPVSSFTDTGMRVIGGTYTGTTVGVDSIVWKFGDGTEATGTTAHHTFAAAGTYHVCVIAYSHCGNDTACSYDTVLCVTAPVASFTDTGMHTIGTTYTGTMTGVDSVVWAFGDGSVAHGATALHTFTATGIYHVCVTAYSPCGSSTACKYDTVLCIAPPVASFTDTGTHRVGFTYTGSTAGLDSIVWNYGDAHSDTGTFSLHTYSVAGTFTFCISVYTPCGSDSVCGSVTITIPPNDISENGSSKICVYPNPANDQLTIVGISEQMSYRLLNIAGFCIEHGIVRSGTAILSLHQLSDGLYILELVGESGNKKIFKVVKEH